MEAGDEAVNPTDFVDAIESLTERELLAGVFLANGLTVGLLCGIIWLWCKDKRKLLSLTLGVALLQGATAGAQTIEHVEYVTGSSFNVSIPAVGVSDGSIAFVVAANESTDSGLSMPFGITMISDIEQDGYTLKVGYFEITSADFGTSLGTVLGTQRNQLIIVAGLDIAPGVSQVTTTAPYDTLTGTPGLSWGGSGDAFLLRGVVGTNNIGLDVQNVDPGWNAEADLTSFKLYSGVASLNGYDDLFQFKEQGGFAGCFELAFPVSSQGGGGSPPYTNPPIPSLGDDGTGCVVGVVTYEMRKDVYGWFWGPPGTTPDPNVPASHPATQWPNPLPSPPSVDQATEDWLDGNGHNDSNRPGWYMYFVIYNGAGQAACETCSVGCGVCDSWGDIDGDGIPNNTDPDNDNDSISTACDVSEACSTLVSVPCSGTGDADGDGIINSCDPDGDIDGDTIPDGVDSSPYGPGCAAGVVGGCLPGDDFDGNGIRNDAETNGDVDGDGILDANDNTPYGCGPGTGCTCYPCDDDGDADNDGIPNNDPAETDDDGDGQDDSYDPCPRGCSCCTEAGLNPDLDYFCGQCTDRYAALQAAPSQWDKKITVAGVDCTRDYTGEKIDAEDFAAGGVYELDKDCDWDGDECLNSKDDFPCNADYGCERCDFEINSRLQLVRYALLCWLTKGSNCWAAGNCGELDDLDNDGDRNFEDFDIDGDGEFNDVDPTPWGSCMNSDFGGYGSDPLFFVPIGPPRVASDPLTIKLPEYNAATKVISLSDVPIMPAQNAGMDEFWTWFKRVVLAGYAFSLVWVAVKLLGAF